MEDSFNKDFNQQKDNDTIKYDDLFDSDKKNNLNNDRYMQRYETIFRTYEMEYSDSS